MSLFSSPFSRVVLPCVMASVCLATSISIAAEATATDIKPIEIGDRAPDFDLPGVDGKNHTLAEYSDAELLLVIFTCNHCPTAQAYEERMRQLDKTYGPKGVKLVAISPNAPDAVRASECGWTDVGDSLDDMKIRAKTAKFEFPYLYDGETQVTSHEYGAVATPHAFLFDKERTLRYSGRIDDSEVETVTDHTTRDAIEALLAGKEPAVTKTRTFGCSVKWADKTKGAMEWIAEQDAAPVTLKMLDGDGLKKLVANAKTEEGDENYLLINLWATNCVPCIIELPEFEQISRHFDMRSFDVVTISLDRQSKHDDALKLLKQRKVSLENYHTSITDLEEFADIVDKDFDGGLPYTLLIAPGGKIVHRVSGEIDPLELRRSIVDIIGRTYASPR